MKEIDLSVIVLIGARAFGLERFLKSFLATQPTEKLEIIFIYPAGFPLNFHQDERFAGVVRMTYTSSDFFAVIRKAIEIAKADYILYQEAHTDLKINIVDTFLRYAKTEQYACIGSLVYPGDELSFTDWVAYLGHYSDWRPGTKPGENPDSVPGHNCVYKKSALLALGDELEICLYADTIIQWHFREKGLKLFLTDEVYLIHDDKMSFGELLAENFWYGWLFAYARRRMNRWGLGKRLLYAIFVFGKPLIRFRLLLKKSFKYYPISGGQKNTMLAAVLLNFFWNAMGESCGALFSDKTAVRKYCGVH